MNELISTFPLYSQEGERAILGAMLGDPKAIDAAAALDVTDFFIDSHRRLLTIIRNMHAQGLHVDHLTILTELTRQQLLESLGGAGWLADLGSDIWRNFDVRPYLGIIREKAKLRRTIALCQAIEARALQGECSEMLLQELQSSAMQQASESSELQSARFSQVALPWLNHLQEQRDSPNRLCGIPTGIPHLDEATSGWRSGELTYIGGLPGTGKTSFMVQEAYVAAVSGYRAGFISLEATRDEIFTKAAILHSRLHASRFRDAKGMTSAEWDETKRSTLEPGGTAELDIEVCDQAGLRVGQVVTLARRMVSNGCKIIFIDFVQRIRFEGRDARESVNRISSTLTEACKSLQVPFVIGSQLARREANPNRRPTMMDLKETSNLEADAHNVFLLYRPKESSRDADGEERPPDWTGRDEIILAKHRNGVGGWVDVTFDESTLSFQPRNLTLRKAAA